MFGADPGWLPPGMGGVALLVTSLVAGVWKASARWRARRVFGRGVGGSILLLSVLVAAIILGNAAVVQRFVAASNRSDPLLALAHQKRLFAQSVEFLVPRLLEGDEAVRPSLVEAIAGYERSLDLLERGRLESPEEVRLSIARAKSTWKELRPELDRRLAAAAAPVAVAVAGRGTVPARLESLTDESTRTVRELEAWRTGLRTRLLHLVGGASILGIAALLVWLKLAWTVLVSPVRRLRDHALRAKERPLVDVPANEIEAIAQAVTDLSSDMEQLRRERARMRHELRRAEADYEAIFENAVAGILRTSQDGAILMANRALARMLGYSSVEELSSAIEDVHRQLFADGDHRARFDELHRTRGHVELETTVCRKDGSALWVLESAYVGEGRDGTRVYETVLVDITPMKKAQDSLRELSALLLRSQDLERRRIARELHDSTGQLLAALKMNLSRIDEVMPLVQDSLSSSLEIASECTRQIRSMSYLLYPPMLEELGLLYALKDFTRGFSQRSGIQVVMDGPQDMDRLHPDTELALFRVVQEALVNIQRHSGSRDALVRIVPLPGMIRLEVEDHGKGISPNILDLNGEPSAANVGVGLRGMKERLRQLGGRTTVESRPGRTLIRAEVPVADDFAAADSAVTRPDRGIDSALS